MEPSLNENKIVPKWKACLLSRAFLRTFAGTLLGGVAGYLYYYYAGCASGSCPITGNPWISTAWGGLMGFLLLGGSSGKC